MLMGIRVQAHPTSQQKLVLSQWMGCARSFSFRISLKLTSSPSHRKGFDKSLFWELIFETLYHLALLNYI